jgi:hypothetical protein
MKSLNNSKQCFLTKRCQTHDTLLTGNCLKSKTVHHLYSTYFVVIPICFVTRIVFSLSFIYILSVRLHSFLQIYLCIPFNWFKYQVYTGFYIQISKLISANYCLSSSECVKPRLRSLSFFYSWLKNWQMKCHIVYV